MLTAWEEQPNRWWWADHPLLCSCTRSSSPLSFFQTSSTCPFPLARATGIKSAPVATMVVSPLSALYHPAASLSPGHPPTVLQTRKNEDLFGKFLSSNFRSALRNDKLKKTIRQCLLFTVACALAATLPLDKPKKIIPILKQINQLNDDGSYTFGYEGGDVSTYILLLSHRILISHFM